MPPRKKSEVWKPAAFGATLAAFVFAGGIGWLARERQRGQAQIATLNGKLKSQLADQEALQRRLYDQNRELALLNTRVRERDTRIAQLLTKLTASEKAVALAVKERDDWRKRASVQSSAPVVIVPTESVVRKPAQDPPRKTSRRRRPRTRRRSFEAPATVAETPDRTAAKTSRLSLRRRKTSESSAPRRKTRRPTSKTKTRRGED